MTCVPMARQTLACAEAIVKLRQEYVIRRENSYYAASSQAVESICLDNTHGTQ